MNAIVTAIQPTHNGAPQLGNLLGALLPLKRLAESNTHANTPIFTAVASLHATTVPGFNPNNLHDARAQCFAALLALDIQRPRNDAGTAPLYLFDQANIPSIPRMATLLQHIASLGQLELMTQFKDKGRGSERGQVGFGLLSYPVLMAADILSVGGTTVPVGEDQLQHLQLARELAQRANKRFGTRMRTPTPSITDAPRIMDLRVPTQKMSKSHPEGAVFLDQSMDQVHKAFRRATSDSDSLPSEYAGLVDRPAARNLIHIYAAMRHIDVDTACAQFAGQGFASLKQALSDAYAEHIAPIGQRMHAILSNPFYLDDQRQTHTATVESIAASNTHTLAIGMGLA